MADQLRHDHDTLLSLALLYASGELDASEAGQFEDRLANDQAARDVLVEAVTLNQTLRGLAALRPESGYRARVCDRLLGTAAVRSRQRAAVTGHPLVWALLGAAAGVLAMCLLPGTLPRRETPTPAPVHELASVPSLENTMPFAEILDDEMEGETVVVWSEVPRGEHLTRAIGDGHRRRTRLEDRRPSRADQRLTRFLEPSETMN